MQQSDDGALPWTSAVLSDACRRETVQAALKNKLRGKRLLLERAVTLPPPGGHPQQNGRAKQGRTGSGGSGSSSSEKPRAHIRSNTQAKRSERKRLLMAAANAVTYEQAERQHAAWHDFYPFIKLIKIDLLNTTTAQIERLFELRATEFPKLKLLAEKVEDYDEFARVKAMGFDLYQGYFFSHPQVIHSRTLSIAQTTITASFNAKDFYMSTQSITAISHHNIAN